MWGAEAASERQAPLMKAIGRMGWPSARMGDQFPKHRRRLHRLQETGPRCEIPLVNAETRSTEVRLAELVASLSLVVDLGLGQPVEHVLRQTLVAMRLGESLGLSPRRIEPPSTSSRSSHGWDVEAIHTSWRPGSATIWHGGRRATRSTLSDDRQCPSWPAGLRP